MLKAGYFLPPACGDAGYGLGPVNGLSQLRSTSEAVELAGAECELGGVARPQSRQQICGGHGRVVRSSVRGSETDSGKQSIRVLSVSRRTRGECDSGEGHSPRSPLPEEREYRAGVDPRRADLLERRLAPPADGQVSPLEEAEARIMVETFQRA
jgi:hypothetical protein